MGLITDNPSVDKRTIEGRRTASSDVAVRRPAPIPASLRARKRRSLVFAVDLLMLSAAVAVPLAVFGWQWMGLPSPSVSVILMSVTFVPVRLACLAHHGLYRFRRPTTHKTEVAKVTNALLWAFLAQLAVSFILKAPPPRSWELVVFFSSLVFTLGGRQWLRGYFTKRRVTGRMANSMVLVGTGEAARAVATSASADRACSVQVVGYADDAMPVGSLVADGLRVVCDLDGLVDYARRLGVQGVVVPTIEVEQPKMATILRDLAWYGVCVEVTFGVEGIDPERTSVGTVGRNLSVLIEPIVVSGWRPAAKRAIDIVASSCLLLVTAPITVLTAILIKLESPGGVLFRQSRIGRDGKVFECLKFRSMVDDAISHTYAAEQIEKFGGIATKSASDPRITRVGKFIRRWSIDEFPQFINILRGDMSLVGPRPLALTDALVPEWETFLPHRHRLRPGLTCTWQVSGRSATTNQERKRLDVFYVDNWTFWGDVMILARTAGVVVRGDGAF